MTNGPEGDTEYDFCQLCCARVLASTFNLEFHMYTLDHEKSISKKSEKKSEKKSSQDKSKVKNSTKDANKCEPFENILSKQESATEKVKPMKEDEILTNKTTEESNISNKSNSQSIHLLNILKSDSEKTQSTIEDFESYSEVSI